MTSLIDGRTFQPTSVFVQRWQSDVLQQTDGAGSIQSTHQQESTTGKA